MQPLKLVGFFLLFCAFGLWLFSSLLSPSSNGFAVTIHFQQVQTCGLARAMKALITVLSHPWTSRSMGHLDRTKARCQQITHGGIMPEQPPSFHSTCLSYPHLSQTRPGKAVKQENEFHLREPPKTNKKQQTKNNMPTNQSSWIFRCS